MCFLLLLILQLEVSPTFSGSAISLFLSARHSCGLLVPCECGFASHGHAVVFLFHDSEETKIAIDKSDTVMLTNRNLGRLDMADTAEAGTDVPSRGLNGKFAEGYMVGHMSAKMARRKVAGVLAKGLLEGARRRKGCCLWCCEWRRRYRDVGRHCIW